MCNILTFLGWGLSSLLFVGALALFQANRSMGLVLVLILWGILCLPPLYKITRKWEADGSIWNILSRLGLLLLIPAFLAPWISKKDLSLYQRVGNPFAAETAPRSTLKPTMMASGSSSPPPVTVSGDPAFTLPPLVPSAIQSGFPTPQPSSSLAAILARMPSPPVSASSPGSPQILPSSLEPPTTSLTTAKSSRLGTTITPQISIAPPRPKSPQPSTAITQILKPPSKVIATNSKSGSPSHRVISEPMVNGSRIVIETDDPNVSREQCKALVKTYMARAKGTGEIVVYKPNPKPPWNGRVLAFCFNKLDEKGTVVNDFW